MKVRVENRQSLFDIAIQENGTPDAAFDFALKNGLSVTASLQAGMMLRTPDESPTNTLVRRTFKDNALVPATDNTQIVNPMAGGYVSEGYWVNGYVKTN